MGYINNTGLTTFSKQVKTWVKTQIANLQNALNPMVSITYADLKALRDASKLVVGRRYRITDFVTTTTQTDTRSAGHAFDVIVKADDVNILNENAKAIQHKDDTYFADCKLSAWELKYCLDNDTTRFAWADTTNGKGVVWWMKDEWNNECFYDFKNIQYKLYSATGQGWTDYLASIEMTAENTIPYRLTKNMTLKRGKYTWERSTTDFIWAYTWSGYNKKETSDKSLKADGTKDTNNDIVHDCKVGGNWQSIQKDDQSVYSRLSLNFYVAIPFAVDTKDKNFQVYSIKLGENCHDIVTGNNCYSWTCGNNCYYWTCGNDCHSWTCGNNCYSWTCGNNCYSWTCGNNCRSWTCGNDCYSWTCGNNSYSWTCGNNCYYWTCGNNCRSWTCGNDCHSWTCGNYCYSWTCGNYCHSWTCGNYCYSWTCGNNSYSWTCGNYCRSWTCGNNCRSWTCGNDCYSWTCGNYCYYWTCGNNCYSWTCGNYCYSWTCGNDCHSWTCGNEVSGTKILQNSVSYFRLENSVSNVTIQSNATPTGVKLLQNFVVKSGVKGTDATKLAITIDNAQFPIGSDYEWIIAKNSNGDVKQYCEADLIN